MVGRVMPPLALLALLASTPIPAASQDADASSEHLRVYVRAHATRRQAQQVARLGERAFTRVTAKLGHTPTEPIVIFVYGQPEGFLAEGGPPQAVGTVTAPHNLVRVDLWRARDGLYRVVAHEIAHVVMARALRSRLDACPRWFNEGVATWASQQWTPADESRVGDMVRRGQSLPPDALESQFGGDAREVRLAYLQSASLVQHLTRLADEDVVARVIEQLRLTGDFDAALERTVGFTADALYEDWRREMAGAPRRAWTRINPDTASLAAIGLVCLIVVLHFARRRLRSKPADPDEEGLTPEELQRAQELEEFYREEE